MTDVPSPHSEFAIVRAAMERGQAYTGTDIHPEEWDALLRIEEQLEAAHEEILFLCSDEDDIRKGLREQYQAALDLLARVQPELAPNWVEANDLRKKLGLDGAPAILEDIATFLSNPASRPS